MESLENFHRKQSSMGFQMQEYGKSKFFPSWGDKECGYQQDQWWKKAHNYQPLGGEIPSVISKKVVSEKIII